MVRECGSDAERPQARSIKELVTMIQALRVEIAQGLSNDAQTVAALNEIIQTLEEESWTD